MRRINPTMVDAYQAKSGIFKKAKEITVNSFSPWKKSLNKVDNLRPDESLKSVDVIDWDCPEDPGVVLSSCSDDIEKLWNDPYVRKLLDAQNIRLEEMGGL